jgi:hypothetical protein
MQNQDAIEQDIQELAEMMKIYLVLNPNGEERIQAMIERLMLPPEALH